MQSLADATVERLKQPSSEKSGEGTPMADALREAWEAVEEKNFEKFAQAFEGAVEIAIHSKE